MRAAIENFAKADYANKIIMIGGMWELGAESIAEHQQIVQLLQQWNWNDVILVGGDFAHTQHSYIYLPSNAEAKEWLENLKPENTAILIKGSRATAMEKVLAL
jgi:UDP-N-acetylmuramoyl-tripeptide--D-alanyl-D-alanine ligase